MKRITLAVLFCAVMLAIIAVPAQLPGAELDRAALIKLADDYFASLVAHNSKAVPLADNIKIVEQVKRIKPGEGLWQTTTSGPTDFKIVIPDTVAQQVGGIIVMSVSGTPSMVGFRLKVENNKITEAEHLIASVNPDSPMVQTPRSAILMEVPYKYRDSRGRLIWIAESYYDALELNNGNLTPFAPDCERRENGARSVPQGGPSLTGNVVAVSVLNTPNKPGASSKAKPATLMGMQTCASQLDNGQWRYITAIHPRRVLIADELTGVAIGFSQLRHPMTQKKFPILNNPGITERDMSNQKPFDMPSLHLYKIWGGQMHEIEAVGIVADYNAPTGWED